MHIDRLAARNRSKGCVEVQDLIAVPSSELAGQMAARFSQPLITYFAAIKVQVTPATEGDLSTVN